MPSDPYQSQFFRKLLRQTRHWLDRRQQTVRQVQVAASWSAQILIYPAYALFQSARSLGKTLGKAIQPDPANLLSTENLVEIEIPLQSTSVSLTAETGLQQIFQVIDRFALPERLPMGLEPQTMRIRAIACLVKTQALVLVTQANQVLDVLLPHQQHELAQRISWEVADYARSQHPKSFPKRVIEALQGVRFVKQSLRESRLFARFRPATTRSLPAASAPMDTPMRQAMLTVRGYLAAIDFSRLPLLKVANSKLSEPSSIFIRGLATRMAPRSLVLVTNRNEILDILDADQQLILQQRIIWEVAHYHRYLRLRHAAVQLDPVRSPSVNSPVFSGVRSFYQLMAWMQQGSVAIATNLFKEADLAKTSTLLPSVPDVTLTLRDRVTAALSPIRHQPDRSVNAELASSQSISSAKGAQPVVMPRFPQGVRRNASRTFHESPDIAISSDSLSPEIIDTEVTLLGYEQSLLERIMRLLDFCFFAIEEFIHLLWTGLLKVLSKQ